MPDIFYLGLLLVVIYISIPQMEMGMPQNN